MGKFEDLTGETFGRLTVISRAPNNKHGGAMWNCKCSCKDETIITVSTCNLKSGHTQSCGCLSIEKLVERSTTHGKTHDKIYNIWQNIIKRCTNPNCPTYKHYGGRGIKICERWLTFENFYEDVSKLPHFGEEGYTLDRINNAEIMNCQMFVGQTKRRKIATNAQISALNIKGRKCALPKPPN